MNSVFSNISILATQVSGTFSLELLEQPCCFYKKKTQPYNVGNLVNITARYQKHKNMVKTKF